MRKSAPMHALEKRKVSSLQNPLTHFLSKTQVGLQKEPGLQKLKNELKKAQERKTNSVNEFCNLQGGVSTFSK